MMTMCPWDIITVWDLPNDNWDCWNCCHKHIYMMLHFMTLLLSNGVAAPNYCQ